jgi:hypothetical protein
MKNIFDYKLHNSYVITYVSYCNFKSIKEMGCLTFAGCQLTHSRTFLKILNFKLT